MRLYHGTNCDFTSIDLKKSRRSKDFGQGFYLSDNLPQAEEMAKHRTKQEGDNRSETPIHDYDVVIGPIADDTIGLQLFQFRKHYINLENLIENLKYKKLTFQYFFGTQKAIAHLKRI